MTQNQTTTVSASRRLVICEKPSVAQSIAAVLGAGVRHDGYLEGGGYLVSWCYGHLAELANADAYDEKYIKWRYDDLPILPTGWQYTLRQDKKKQFTLLRDLMAREDVGEVINACDAGREGELIFRTVYYMTGCTKTMKRLWISSMEDASIRRGVADLRPGRDYDGLYQSALCRARADWLVGINATRLFSVLYHRTLNVGRVLSPTLALLVQREADIDAFRPEAFYTVGISCVGMEAVSRKFRERAEAEALAQACAGLPVTVTAVQCAEKTETSPRLYDLTTLQRDANRLLGYTAQQTLDYLQAIYEKKLCTYPRTDSRFLTDDMEASVPALVSAAAVICETDAPQTFFAKQACDSGKVSDHHGIVPTASAAKADVSVLPLGEREILRLVARQLLLAVSGPHRYMETTVTLSCGDTEFTAKGRTVLDAGWKTYAEKEQPGTALPPLAEGQTLHLRDVVVKEGHTTPPRRYTEDTLLSAMENAGKEDMPEDAERRGLGTPATRAGVIEKLVSAGFAERRRVKKSVQLIPTHTGISLITVLPEQLQSPLLTAEWEHRLQRVERGEIAPDTFLSSIAEMLTELVRTYSAISGAEVLFPSGREVVGICPRCGSNVTESKKGFFCERNECRFGLWRDNKFFAAKRVPLTKKTAVALLKDGRVRLTGLYSEKTGKTYDAAVVLEDTGESVRFRLDFDKEAST
jgi:DNA topoisomerase III